MLLKDTFTMQLMKKDNNGVSLARLNGKIKMTSSLRFGGCTLLDSDGYWFGDGQLYKDDSYRLIINFNRDENTIDHLLDLVKMELIGGNQEAVCFSINGTAAISSSIKEAQDDLTALLNPAIKGRQAG